MDTRKQGQWGGGYGYYTTKHRGGCTRGTLWPEPSITNRARSVRLVIDFGLANGLANARVASG